MKAKLRALLTTVVLAALLAALACACLADGNTIDVTQATGELQTTVSTGINAMLPILGILFAGILVVTLLPRMVKRFVK